MATAVRTTPRTHPATAFTHPQSVQADTNLHSSGLSRSARSGSMIVAREELVLRSSSNTNKTHRRITILRGLMCSRMPAAVNPTRSAGQRAVIKGNLRHVGSPPGPRSAQLAAARPAYLCTAVLNEECAHLPRGGMPRNHRVRRHFWRRNTGVSLLQRRQAGCGHAGSSSMTGMVRWGARCWYTW
jgi:hypothetical protein